MDELIKIMNEVVPLYSQSPKTATQVCEDYGLNQQMQQLEMMRQAQRGYSLYDLQNVESNSYRALKAEIDRQDKEIARLESEEKLIAQQKAEIETLKEKLLEKSDYWDFEDRISVPVDTWLAWNKFRNSKWGMFAIAVFAMRYAKK